jgi:hypothetical protein
VEKVSVGRGSLQERFEGTPFGRVIISAFLVLTLFSVITANMYPSYLKNQFLRVAKPYVYVTGLDQGWDVFAPDPRRRTVALRAEIVYADGSRESWRIPSGGSLIGAYWDYRWRKWVELMLGGFNKSLEKPAAQWIARNQSDPNRTPVRIQLVERWYDIAPPGEKPNRTEWRQGRFYNLDLTKAGGG